jgi:hypothetical protein
MYIQNKIKNKKKILTIFPAINGTKIVGITTLFAHAVCNNETKEIE